MVRVSECVLPGHPDKLCDAVAEAIVQATLKADPHAYSQIEVSVWEYDMWLTGEIVSKRLFEEPLEEIARETVVSLGYTQPNAYDGRLLRVKDSVRRSVWSRSQCSGLPNDQCICIGWAGYDEKVDYLPPEHWLARQFAAKLAASCLHGALKDQGPDGKLIIRLREDGNTWKLEHVLVTLQHLESTPLEEVVSGVQGELCIAYDAIQTADRRWTGPWDEVDLTVNPNGPLVAGGPLGDNGQTGRKLVMDYFGPRVPIGGGALYGKAPTHIDRIGARVAREAAVYAVKAGAKECLVRVAYTPNIHEPLDVCFEMEGRGNRMGPNFFTHGAGKRGLTGQSVVAPGELEGAGRESDELLQAVTRGRKAR